MDVTAELPGLYREARKRVSELVCELDDAELATPVPCCPAWTVAEVVAHVTAIADESLRGALSGPPSDEETQAQLRRFAGQTPEQVCDKWSELAAELEPRLAAPTAWPVFLDLLAHEHDIRGAIGRPGNRDDRSVTLSATRLIRWLRPPVGMLVRLGGEEHRLGPDDEPILLRCEPYEAFRWRLGRRSREQLAALDWSADPTALLDSLCVFGPSPKDILE